MAPNKSLSRREITALFATAARVVRHPCLDILVAPKTQSEARLVVITPKRTGTAPARNKVRRQLKAIFYEQQYYLQGCDCAVIIKNMAELSFEKLKELLAEGMAKGTKCLAK